MIRHILFKVSREWRKRLVLRLLGTAAPRPAEVIEMRLKTEQKKRAA